MQLCDKFVKIQQEVMDEQKLSAEEAMLIVERMFEESGEPLKRLDETPPES